RQRRDAGGLEALRVLPRQAMPFPDHDVAGAHAVGGDGTDSLGDRKRAEPHAPSPCLRLATSSARMASAISAGLTAPMDRPMGAWIRPISAGVKPACVSRSTRRPCVFREPSAPM